jgi:uncharacterized membrane protein YbaN (DUF454 family)
MLTYWEWILSVIFIGMAGFFVSLVYYRKTGIAFWGYMGALLPDMPTAVLLILGATSIQNVQLASHTIGLLFWPVLLVVADVLLIEAAMLKAIKPFAKLLPKGIRSAFRIQKIVESLQKHHAIPRPERVRAVYFAALAGGIINLAVGMMTGTL